MHVTIVLVCSTFVQTSPKDELKHWQGNWRFVAGESEGKKLAEEELPRPRLAIDGKNYAYTGGDEVEHGTFTFDQRKDPREIDLRPKDGRRKGTVIRGIYRFDGGDLTLCFAPPGKDRPKSFA